MTTPVYATTQRQSINKEQADGSIITKHIFKPAKFREYWYSEFFIKKGIFE